MTFKTLISSRCQVFVALTVGVYLTMACRSHFNQMLTHANSDDGSQLYSSMNCAYQVAYATVQVLALYADRVSPAPFLGIIILSLAVTSFVAPFVLALMSASSPPTFAVFALGVLFAINGTLAGSWWPFMNAMLSNWSPPVELAFVYAAVNTGVPGGIVLGNAYTGLAYALKESEFRYSFFLLSILCALWSIVWFCNFYSNPSDDPGIRKEELEYLNENIQPKIKFAIPWWKIITSLPVWSLMVTNYGSTIFYTVLIMYMPMYLKNMMKLELSQNGFMSTLPPIGQIIVMYLAGYYASLIQKRQWLDVTKIRKMFTCIGMILPACLIIIATLFTSHHILFYGLLVMAYAFSGSVFSGYRVSQMELAPNFVATITALCDLVGSLAMNTTHIAFITYFNKTSDQKTWDEVCWIMIAVLVAGASPYFLVGSSETQPWNNIDIQTNV